MKTEHQVNQWKEEEILHILRWFFLLNSLDWKLQHEFLFPEEETAAHFVLEQGSCLLCSAGQAGNSLSDYAVLQVAYCSHVIAFQSDPPSFARYKSAYIEELSNTKPMKFFLKVLLQCLFDYEIQTCPL